MHVAFRHCTLSDPIIVAYLADAKFVMIDQQSRFRGGRKHLRLHRDGKGSFVRVGCRGSGKRYLAACKVVYLDGVATLYQFSFA